MKILLDHCVPKPFGRQLPSHEVCTTAQMGWAELKNGLLLAEAAKTFHVFLTVDKNIKSEQNLHSLPIPVVVLDVMRNTPNALAPFAPFVAQVLPGLRPGQMVEIRSDGSVAIIAEGH